MDRITEQLSQLQELNNEELSELEELITSEFSATEQQELNSQTTATMTQLADAMDAVRAEQSRRATEAQALQEAAAAAAARIKGPEAVQEDSEEESAEVAPEGEAAVEPKHVEDAEQNPEAPVPPAESVESPETIVDDANEDDADEIEKTKRNLVPKPDVASVEEAPASEAAVEQPEGSEAASEEVAAEAPAETAAEAAVEETVEAEASAETPAESEASEEAPAEAELSAEAPAEAEASVEEEASSETPVEAEAAVEESNTNTEETVTAAANGSEGLEIEVPADRKPIVKPTATLTITAGADIPGTPVGATFKDSYEVAEAFQKRLHGLRHVHGGDGEQHIVASYRQEFPEDRELTANDTLANTDRIQNVTSPEAITAAAGICLPLETRYDMGCDVGVTDRPVRDALARFGADRGGIRFFSAPTLSQDSPNFADATGFWRGAGTDPNSGTFHTYGPDRTTATSPADAKPCLELNCVEEQTAYIEAITLCLTFNNLTTRTFPELVKRQNELALVAHARVAENALLAQLEAGSTAVTAQAQVVGATREILNLIDRAVASYRFKHRMASNSPLRIILPAWVRNLIRADIALQMPGDGVDVLTLADNQIDAWFRSRNVNTTYHLDGVGPALVDSDGAGSGTAQGFELPSTLEFALFAEGTWLFLDGGTLDLGVIRDSSLVASNQYKQFVESFEGVANIGCDSYWVTAAYEPTGAAAALVDTTP